ncbi:unnamed protein product [Acanthoscelides obtectus]|uniref:Uncharacterized protein n=1 Tax=Acanthoscelides obtectus TaxID=200917 RepID=A0A9P0NWG8_ACAOB|nr:unnamed protein product [Acanthoscelides obtectus]CAK1663709.1 hypothetical protein AOBTE_LOCUS23811 [Acanthoscelides obtectus]
MPLKMQHTLLAEPLLLSRDSGVLELRADAQCCWSLVPSLCCCWLWIPLRT